MLHRIHHIIRSASSIGKQKIFCIGRNKTGTTSIARALSEMGYYVAPQRPAELLLGPETYKYLHSRFPDSKFVLTIRDNPEEWYDSLIRFHSRVFGNGSIPKMEDLMNATYVYRGWAWEANRYIYNSPEDDPYNKEILLNHYNSYNKNVCEYFNKFQNSLLVLNLKDPSAPKVLSQFLQSTKGLQSIPWLNKTADINT